MCPADSDPHPWPRPRASLPAALQGAAARLRRAVGWIAGRGRWHWLPPGVQTESLSIPALISPLRYDVILRQQMIDFYLQRRELFVGNFGEFARQARVHPYHVWFEEIFIPRYFPHFLGNTELLRAGYEHKFSRLISLYEHVAREGYRAVPPVELFAGRRVVFRDSGCDSRTRYFLGDGCHRLAVLLTLGIARLPPDGYRVRLYDTLEPLDITAELLRHLRLEPAEYFRFLSARYTEPVVCHDLRGLLQQVRAVRPHDLPEVEWIVRRHGFG